MLSGRTLAPTSESTEPAQPFTAPPSENAPPRRRDSTRYSSTAARTFRRGEAGCGAGARRVADDGRVDGQQWVRRNALPVRRREIERRAP